jgi:hypothetical protein
MRHIFILTCIFTLILSCSNTTKKQSETELNQEFKKYHIQLQDIEKGVVRITKVIGHDKEDMKYSLFRMTSENRFVRENYNSDFVLVSKTYHKEKTNGSEEVKTIIYQNNEQFPLNIIKPEYMTYSSKDTLFLSEYESGYLNVKTKCRYIGKSSIEFKGNTIECIIYERNILRKYSRPGQEFEDNTVSRAYYGEKLGVIYAT